MEHLDWNEVLKKIQSFATSGTARLTLQELPPKSNADEARLHLNDVFDAMTLLSHGPRPFMESLDLFEPWHSRIKRNAVLKALEIKDVRSFCLEVIALDEVLKLSNTAWARRTQSQLMAAEEPLSAIDQILTPRGEIRSDASEKLYNLFREKENLARQVEHTLDRLVKDNDMQTYLQDKYVTTRDGRWVLPIRSGSRHSVEGVIHGSSHTKQTVFMEPAGVIPLNNRLRQVEVEIEDEIERLLTQLSEYLATKTLGFTESRSLLSEADSLLAQAQFSVLIEGKGFEFSDEEILLNEVKHPLLVIAQKNPVANTVQMPQQKSILLLSGPNAGGKTVLMKSIGLAAQMARAGLPICAGEGSRLPFFEKILVGIGDSQNIGAELSTFAAHLKVLHSASELKGFQNLILVDEICGATDPEEGSALARAFIEKFSKNKTFAVVTSHLGPLKSGWTEDDRVLNGSLEYDSKSGRPTYQFIQGIPGDSLAIQTAKRVGVPQDLIERAMTLLSPVTRSRLAGLEQIEQIKSDLHLLQDSLKREKSKTFAEKEKYQKLLAEHEKDKENLLAKAVREAQKKVDELISQARADETFKKHRSLQEIKHQLPEIVKSRAGVTQQVTAVTTSEEFGKRFPPGTKVYIPSLGQDGVIQSTPNGKGEILVMSNSIRLSLPWSELKPPMVASNPTAEILRRSGPVTVALHDSDRVIDLRGMTVEESIEQLEMSLDQASASQEDRIKIVHGHGTEALKKAVRTYLSRSVYVKKWKAGSPEQGGDGVTWAELGDA
ncbi:MAG: endonuclease MutS2 [Bdellovibrio sp.]